MTKKKTQESATHMLVLFMKKNVMNAECDICAKTFSHSQSLVRHYSKIHESQIDPVHESKIYECDICAKKFLYSQSLMKHYCKVHKTTSNNYKCESCSESFSDAEHLKSHIHEGHKYHNCESCDKTNPSR